MMPGGEVQEINAENFETGSGSLGTRDMRQGIVLCLGGLLAMLRGAKADEGVCGVGQCQVQARAKTESMMDMMTVTMCVMEICILIGLVLGWKLRGWWGDSKKERRGA